VSLPGAGETESSVLERLNSISNDKLIEDNQQNCNDKLLESNVDEKNQDNFVKIVDENLVASENLDNFINDEILSNIRIEIEKFEENNSLSRRESEISEDEDTDSTPTIKLATIYEEYSSQSINSLSIESDRTENSKELNNNFEENFKENQIEEKIIIEEIGCKSVEEKEQEREEDCEKPPIPIYTYCWEDLRRSKEQGGYPWTHLYKLPLGPDDEPEIVLRYRSIPKRKRKTQEKLLSGNSPKFEKKLIIFQDPLLPVEQDIHQQILRKQ
jgi:hypothetical protein